MHVKKNIQEVTKEVFEESIICEHCKEEIREDTELTVNQSLQTFHADEENFRDFHFCNTFCLGKFLENKPKKIFNKYSPLGFYFKGKAIVK